MNSETESALIGQLAADAVVRDALLVALMEVIPDLGARVASKVAATAPGVQLGLPDHMQQSFRGRLQEVLALVQDATAP
jgi:hypothetical protein